MLERFALERGPSTNFVLNPYEHLLDDDGLASEAGEPMDPAELTALLDRAFELARGRGQEGLVLKRIDAVPTTPADADRRGSR